ncbi:hypothetical protein TSAR_010473 [Trichomalopsis sarcophagae]|uniref:RRM domain-containing protein n=1 Tax=Trichomalopsis sarcophagae TaxID=543379 RepID=A0A232F9X8_9HYME|nr:hypothetical protein TSAR_010473 [Trichomalopsis sarcophagae]
MECKDDNELFRQDPMGKYQVLFLNTAGLSLDDIKKIFSNFGEVDYVHICGNKTGYRFVKYRSIDEVERAIKGLKYNPLIKLIPPTRRRKKSKTRNENFNKSDEGHSYKGSNESEKSEYTVDVPQTQPRKSRTGNQSISSNKNSFTSCTRSQTSEQEISDMIVSNGKGTLANDMNKKVMIDAEEVIIGNIPIKYSAPYILHLFNYFEPIAISDIKVIPESSIRYCHVYFKRIQDCLEVERLFDQVALSGQKLIVQRPSTLMANAVLD